MGVENEKDLQKASQLFKQSADMNDPMGLNSYGIALLNGYSGEKNLPEATKYYQMAADLGNPA
jgi:TPR repeat protein